MEVGWTPNCSGTPPLVLADEHNIKGCILATYGPPAATGPVPKKLG